MWEEAADLPEVTAESPVPPSPVDGERRCIRVNIDASFLQALITQADADTAGNYERRCVCGLPRGAQLAGVYIDGAYVDPMISLVFRHPDFDPVPPTQMIPEFLPTWQIRRIGEVS